MKYILRLLTIALLSSSLSYAALSASNQAGSCSACKVEQGQNPLAQQAVDILVNGGEITQALRNEMLKVKNNQSEKVGADFASKLTDEDLLLMISGQ